MKKKYKNIETAIFKLEGVEPNTAKNGTTQLMTLFLEDGDGKQLVMSAFKNVWDSALLNGFDFEGLRQGEDVEIDFVRNGQFLNLVDIRSRVNHDPEMPF